MGTSFPSSLNYLYLTFNSRSSSGVGDHGQDGIDTFLNKHECVNRCTNLRLSCEGFALASEKVTDDSDDDE
jgi:hypothetical protein